LGIVFTVFALVILIGSVHLAWHYAVDGYAAVIAVGCLWVVVGAVLRRIAPWLGLPESVEVEKNLAESGLPASAGAE
jgi:hypothetical protein